MTTPAELDLGAKRLVMLGVTSVLILVLGFGIWAFNARIDGAIIAQGRVEADRIRHIVQHPTGGVAKKVWVTEGQAVQADDVLIELDVARQQRELGFVQEQLFDLLARQERLEALYSGQTVLAFSQVVIGLRGDDPERAALLHGQQKLFEANLQSRAVKTQHFKARQAQLAARIVGLEVQVEAVARQLPLTAAALENQKTLFARSLVPAVSVLQLEQEMSRLEGRLGELQASKAQAHEQVIEAQIMVQQELSLSNEAALAEAHEMEQMIRKLRSDTSHLFEEISGAQIYAPVSGRVHGLQVQIAGAVVRPAEPLLQLIPQDQPPVIKLRVSPGDIDQITYGQEVKMRLSALDAGMTPEVFGQVIQISADVHRDAKTEAGFFQVEVMLNQDTQGRLPLGARILPGMPVEAYIYTQAHSPLGYLVKPIADYFARALRES